MSSEASPDNTKEDKEKQVPVEAASTNNETSEKKQSPDFERTDFMAKESIGKVMWKLTYPSLIAKVVSAMYAVCDSAFIGKLAGETEAERLTALSAVSLAMPLEQGIIHSLAMMVSNGGSTVYGQAVGEHNVEKGRKVIGNTYFLEICVAIILIILAPLINRPLLILLKANEEANTLPLGLDYVNTLFYGSICYCLSMASADLIRGQGSAVLSCIVSIVSAVCNIIGDPLYIKVFGLGVMGAALSTVLANLVSSVIGVSIMCSKKAVVRFGCAVMKPSCQMDKNIMVTGMSGLVSGFAGAFVTIISNLLVLHYSKYPAESIETKAVLSAWGSMSKVYFVSFMPLIALAQGVLPLLAYSFGAKLHSRFMRCSKIMFIWEIGITIVLEALILIFTPFIAKIFSDEEHFLEFFVPAMRIMVSGVFLQPLVMSLFPMLQSVGKGGLGGMLLALKTCVIPLVLQLGISWMVGDYWGAVYAYPVTEVVSALLAVLFYVKNRHLFEGSQELPVVKKE